MELGTVRQIDIDQEMQTAYLDYAMSVIVARALPDVRDGLKPVQRRILYAMHDMGLRPDRPYKKSARIVGETLGKYHPHGDSAVYEAMARMAQDFSLRYPLVDGQGNFGCFTGDTKIKLLDGTERSFEELAARPADEVFYVYSVDEHGRVVVGEGRNARVTRRQARLVELALDNGEKVRCTPDHRFMLRDGSYKAAQDLTPADSLMPGYFRMAPVKEGLNEYLQVLQPGTAQYEFVHHLADRFNYERELAPAMHGPVVRHHLNGNRWDNRPSNIERTDFLAHLHLHAEQIHEMWEDPAFREAQRQGVKRYYDEHPDVRAERRDRFARQNQDASFRHENGIRVSSALKQYFEDNPERRLEISQRMRALWADPDYRDRMSQALTGIKKRPLTAEQRAQVVAIISEKSRAMWGDESKRAEIIESLTRALASEEVRARMREAAVSNWQDPEYRGRYPEDHFAAMARALWENPATREQHRLKIARQRETAAFRIAQREGVRQSNARRMVNDPSMMLRLGERAAAVLTEKWQDSDYRARLMRRKVAGYVARLLTRLPADSITPQVYEANRDANWVPHADKAVTYFDDWEHLLHAARNHNHRVTSIRWLDEPVDVYDITVERYHNFLLAAGVFVHNSIDGDNPAAMRYTEARLALIAEEVLADIDKDTVDFGPNFDGTLTEPLVLPAVLPNLLLNGASGIAVGMTTNVPPHNLGEVCDALMFLIDDYARLDDITVEDLSRFVQGPDFPTGGVVYRYAGESDDGDRNDVILNAYAMGRGRLTVQARVHIEEMSRNRSRIVVSELPYQVNKTRLIERIAELVRDGKLEGITDLRDESDRRGMRLIIEMTRTVEPRKTLSQLFKLTPMQITFGMMMVALVDGEPRLLSLKKVLTHYLDHRQDVITRRSKYLLERARQRAHILEGLLIALDHIDQVIALIRRSRNTETARVNLIKEFKLTEIQAQAILDMPLKRLAALERRRIADEHKETLDQIKYLQTLLRSPAKIRGVIREDLAALKEKYGDARRTQIVDREKGYHTAHDLVEAEEVHVTLWHNGEVSRQAQLPAVSGVMPLAQLRASTRDSVAFFTAAGQAALISVHQVPDDRALPVSGLTALDRAETPVGAVVLPQPEGEGNGTAGYLTLATRSGRIKRVSITDLAAAASRGVVTAISVEAGDQLGWVALTDGQNELLLVTRQGKAIRFAEEEVRAMGLSAAGVLAIKLADDDAVVGMGAFRPGSHVITIGEQGYIKRTSVDEFPTQKRYGGGVQAAKVSARLGLLALAAVAAEGERLALLTTQGEVLTVPVKAIPVMGRASTGQKKRLDTKESLIEPARQGAPVALTVLAPAGDEPAGKARAAGGPRTSKSDDQGPAKPTTRGGKATATGAKGKTSADKPAVKGKGKTVAKEPAARGKGAATAEATKPAARGKGAAKAEEPGAAGKGAAATPKARPAAKGKSTAGAPARAAGEERRARAKKTAAQSNPAGSDDMAPAPPAQSRGGTTPRPATGGKKKS